MNLEFQFFLKILFFFFNNLCTEATALRKSSEDHTSVTGSRKKYLGMRTIKKEDAKFLISCQIDNEEKELNDLRKFLIKRK